MLRKASILVLLPLCLAAGEPTAPGPEVASLLPRNCTTSRARGRDDTVTFPPGGFDPVYRHPAHALIYVLEGSVVMQMSGEKEVTPKAGETCYDWGSSNRTRTMRLAAREGRSCF